MICYACNKNGFTEVAGFVSFRFERELEHPVLYCYEIQLYHQFCGQSVGSFLMKLLANIATNSGMQRVLLTVFKKNTAAQRFFRKNGFSIDQSDPSKFKNNQVVDYNIFSKIVT